MGDFEYAILSDDSVHGFMSGDGSVDEPLADEIRETAYLQEIAEIARLREALRSKYDSLAGRQLTTQARARGLQILAQRLAMTEAMYRGEPLPEFEKLEPIGQESGPVRVEPVKSRPKVGPRWAAKAAGLKYYTPDYPCKRGHSKRLTSTGACPECDSLLGAAKTARRRALRLAVAV